MKLRILTTLLLAGSIIASAEIPIVEGVDVEIKTLSACDKKKKQVYEFIKKHKYKIAAGVTVIIGVGGAAYYYYHGTSKFLGRNSSKKPENIENNQNKNAETNKEKEVNQKIELKRLSDNIESAIENSKSPNDKFKAQKEFCEYLIKTGKEDWTYNDGVFENKNDGRLIVKLDFGLATYNRREFFVKNVDKLYLAPDIENIFIKSFDESTYNALLNFELVVAEKKLDQFDFSIIQTLRELFRDNIIDKEFCNQLTKK